MSLLQSVSKGNSDNDCSKEDSRVYVQYSCDFKDIVKSQQMKGLFVACVAILSSSVMYLGIYYGQEKAKMEYALWDLSTATVADYAVQVTITESIWKKWL